MTNINRRYVLRSLAASTVLAGVVPAEGAPAKEVPEAAKRNGKPDLRRGAWFIARQSRKTPGHHTVDFWSKPLCEIRHPDFLPADITRGVLWHDHAGDGSPDHPALEYVDSVFRRGRSDWINDPHQFAEYVDGTNGLTSVLPPMISEKTENSRCRRTALLDLDSQWASPMDPDWADMLPAFRRCYDRVIGHFHLEARGFRHWKKWLTQFDDSYFEQFFSKAASQCDAVILTSGSLAEHDSMHSPTASTEELVGQLMQRFGHALLDENTLEQILPVRSEGIRRHTRVFALASVTLTASWPKIDEKDLLRQRALVEGSFGNNKHMRPLMIATYDNEFARLGEDIRDRYCGTHIAFLRTMNRNRLRGEDSREPLDLFMLWPFDAEID